MRNAARVIFPMSGEEMTTVKYGRKIIEKAIPFCYSKRTASTIMAISLFSNDHMRRMRI